jgi:dipeptidyl aminopeptidase/acylaminoacyl peptidase
MRQFISILLFLLIQIQMAYANPSHSELIEKFLKIRTPTKPAFDHQGNLYTLDFPTGTLQLYRVSKGQKAIAEQPMTQITQFQDGISSFSISPNGVHLIMAAAQGGNEKTQIYQWVDQKVQHIIGNDKTVSTFLLWKPDSSGFFYSSNESNLKDFHLYYWDINQKKSTKILAKSGQWKVSHISSQMDRLLIEEYLSASHAKVYEINISDLNTDPTMRQMKEFTIHQANETAYNQAVGYLPGDDKILLISDKEGYPQLYLREISSPNYVRPIPSIHPFTIDQATISADQKFLTLLINENGYASLKLFLLPSLDEIIIPEIPKGVVSVEPIVNQQLIWTISNAQSPNLSYAWTIGSNEPARNITEAFTAGIELTEFTLPELIQYQSFDQKEIPAFLYLPPNYPKDPQKRYALPFVVNYHGGPEAQFRPYFDRNTQILLKMGFGVIQPNVRGSTGYGRNYQMSDDYQKRWQSVQDGYFAAKWLVDQKYAQPGKIATYGGSYGGFMSIACLVEDSNQMKKNQQPRLFGAGVDVVGIVNFKTFLEQTADYRRKLREVEYGPLSDPEFLKSISTIHRTDEINVNLMIAHGLNDPRVPVGEAMQLAVAMQNKGFDPELLFFADEGHGFAKLPNRILFVNRLIRFLNREIGSRSSTETP